MTFGSDRLTVAELIDALSDAPPDAEIRLAYQPNWPLAASLSAVMTDADAISGRPDDEDGDGRPDRGVIWLAAGDLPYNENPYAPKGAWEGGVE